MRVLAIGECMAELAPSEQEGDFRLGYAGDTFNTAWYLSRITPKADVSYLSAVGDDAISQKMRGFMQDSGIDDRFVQTATGKTVGLYLISLDQGERSFSYWRGQSAAKDLADDPATLDSAMAQADLVFFSGISLAILPPKGRANLLSALREARAAGKTIAYDPNLRPKLWASGKEMTAAIMEAAAVCDMVLPSFEDEADWFNDANPGATAQRYLDAGAKTVVVKNGAAPVWVVDGPRRFEIPVSPLDKVIDTTAAGDSFNAGVFAGQAVGLPLADAVAYACLVSREVVQHKGALVQASLPALPN